MSGNSNKNWSTLPKPSKTRSRKVDTNDQSTFTDSVLAGLINDVVERAKSSLQDPSSNNNSAS
ncbi:21902_t:CDS:1, partial [Gigaspora rosea]